MTILFVFTVCCLFRRSRISHHVFHVTWTSDILTLAPPPQVAFTGLIYSTNVEYRKATSSCISYLSITWPVD